MEQNLAFLLKKEQDILKFWTNNGIKKKIDDKNKNKEGFYFLEGPPYANGELHLGHVRGYTRKDAILRYKRLRGYKVYDRAGFDVHGLPIENKVEKDFGIKNKKEIESNIGIDNFINACIREAEKNMADQINTAIQLGVWLDFENKYVPYTPDYIDKTFRLFKTIWDKGLVYKSEKVMPYCIHCGTVLASGPEVEEKEETDPSIFVLFKVNDELTKNEELKNTYLVIWTTTPWTITDNVAVAVNPHGIYILGQLDDKKIILLKSSAKLLEKYLNKEIKIIKEFEGKELKDIYYINPLEDLVPIQKELRDKHRVILDDSVELTEGSGILHLAPAHGPEDYEIGKRENLPLVNLINKEGIFIDSAGPLKGIKLIHDANREVENLLKNNGSLLYKTDIVHAYPHCWRCKEKLIFLPTEQWFINVEKLKDDLINACNNVAWYPKELKNWFTESIKLAPDWVISRQRYWGIPIPIWVCDNCGNTKVIGSIDELEKLSGIKIERTVIGIHKPKIDTYTIKCDKCNGTMHRIPDVFDVWFDSGVAHTASIDDSEFNNMFGKFFVTEGPDQIRGWFATLAKTAFAAYSKLPFSIVMMQGWVVDEKGEAMHKSKGNYVAARDLINNYSIDAIRMYMLSHIIHEALKFSKREILEMQNALIVMHNISKLINEYSTLYKVKFTNDMSIRYSDFSDLEDKWIVSRINSLIKIVTDSFENYAPNEGMVELYKFLIEDFSRFYLKYAKKRINNGKDVELIINLIRKILYYYLLLLAPYAPYNTEAIYKEQFNFKESIFLEDWPNYNENDIDYVLENNFEVIKETISAILNLREKNNISLKEPVELVHVEFNDDSYVKLAKGFKEIIKDYVNSKDIVFTLSQQEFVVKPIYNVIGPIFKEKTKAVVDQLSRLDQREIIKELNKNNYVRVNIENEPIEIRSEYVKIVPKIEQVKGIVFRFGTAYIEKGVSEETKKERMIREFERNIQLIRKKLNLSRANKIEIYVEADKEFMDLIEKNKEKIEKTLNASITKEKENKILSEFDVDKFHIKVYIAH